MFIQIRLKTGTPLYIPYPDNFEGKKTYEFAKEIFITTDFRIVTLAEFLYSRLYFEKTEKDFGTLQLGTVFIDNNDPLLFVSEQHLDELEDYFNFRSSKFGPGGYKNQKFARVTSIRERGYYGGVDYKNEEIYPEDVVSGEIFGVTLLDILESYSPALSSFYSLSTQSNKIPYLSDEDSYSLADFTAVARTFLSKTNATDQRGVLGIRSAALFDLDDAAISTENLWTSEKINTEFLLKEDKINKNQPDGYLGLDENALVDPAFLPDNAISKTHVVDVENGMLALNATIGDLAVVTVSHKSYFLTKEDPTVLENWQEILSEGFGATGLAAGSVTFDKIQNLNANVLLGRKGVSSGSTEEITCTEEARLFLSKNTKLEQRSSLGLAIGVNVQEFSNKLQSIANTTTAPDQFFYSTSNGSFNTSVVTPSARIILSKNTIAEMRGSLGLGTVSVQNSNNVFITGGNISGISPLPIGSGGTGGSIPITARSNLGLSIGSDIQAYNQNLNIISSLSATADSFFYFTGATSGELAPITFAGRNFLSAPNVETQRQMLGLGGASTSVFGTTSGTIAEGDKYFPNTGGEINGDVIINSNTDAISKTTGALVIPTGGLGIGGTLYANSINTSDAIITGGNITGIIPLGIASGGTGASNPSNARLSLGLGTIATQSNSNISITGGNITGITPLEIASGGTAAGDALNARLNLGLEIGTDVQPFSGELGAIANLTSTANTLPYFTGLETAELTPLSLFSRTLLDDENAATWRGTLELGDISTQDSNNISITGGNISGITPLEIPSGGTGAANAADARLNLGLGDASLLDAGVALGAATLDAGGKILTSQLPSFVDDVVEYPDFASLPATGEANKIYITIDNNLTYRWSGSVYVEISASLALGNTSSTAYRGDYGEIAYNHSQEIGNPHSTQIADISGLQTTLDAKQPLNANLSSFSSLVSTANTIAYFTEANTSALTPFSLFSRNILANTDAISWRGTLELGTISIQNSNNISVTGGNISGISPLEIASGGTGAGDALNARLNLGLEIGSDVQAFDLKLNSFSGLLPTANTIAYFIDENTVNLTPFTSVARDFLSAPDVFSQRDSIGLGSVYGYASLNENNKISAINLPASVFAEIYSVANEAEMLALQAEIGHIAIRTDLNDTFILKDINPTLITSWQQLVTPQNVSGNAATASSLETSRTISANGDVSFSFLFDGTTDVNAIAAISDKSVTNNKLADMTASTIKGAEVAGEPQDLSPNQIRNLLNVEDGSTSNFSNTILLGRSNHTGFQPGNTVLYDNSSGLLSTNIQDAIDELNSNLQIGTTVQGFSDELEAIGGLTSSADTFAYFTGAGIASLTPLTLFSRSLLDKNNATDWRSTLGLGTISTQNSSNIAITGGNISGINPLAILDGGTGAGDALNARSNLGLEIGLDIQPFSGNLQSVANLNSAADTIPYFTGLETASLTPLSLFSRTLLDDENALTWRGTLGLGTIATQDFSNISITGGSISGITPLAIAEGGTGGGDLSSAINNLKITVSDPEGITGASKVQNIVFINQANYDAIVAKDPNTIYHITNKPELILTENTTITLYGKELVESPSATFARNVLGLNIGGDVQGFDLKLDAFSALTPVVDKIAYFTGSETLELTDITSVARSFLGAVDAFSQRQAIGLGSTYGYAPLDINSEVPLVNLPLVPNSNLSNMAALTIKGAEIPGAPQDLTASQIRGIINVADGATANNTDAFLQDRANHTGTQPSTTITYDNSISGLISTDIKTAIDELDSSLDGLVIGTTVQGFSIELDAIAGLVSAADQLPYFTGLGTADLTTITPAGRALLDDSDNNAQLTTLGIENLILGATGGTSIEYLTQLQYDAIAIKDPNRLYVLIDGNFSFTVSNISDAGTMAIQNASSIFVTGGTIAGINDLAITDGGTGASDVAGVLLNFGLNNLNNTSDVDKPISTATQTALDLKQDLSSRGAPGGYPSLDGNSLLPQINVPILSNSKLADMAAFTIKGAEILGAPQDLTASQVRTIINVVDGATANSTDAFLLDRVNHTGTQPSITITYDNTVSGLVSVDVKNAIDELDSVLDGMVIGVDVQAFSNNLSAISGLTSAADKLPYFTGIGTAGLTSLTAFTRSLLENIDAPSARTTLGLGTSSVLNAGVASGVATLDITGKIPSGQLPSFVSASLALGNTSSTAYRGDYGEIAYNHSLSVTGNPHSVTAANVGLGNVDNTSDSNKPISTATQAALDTKQAADVELTALAGLNSAADQLPYFTGNGTADLTTITAAGKALIDDVDNIAQLSTLGISNLIQGDVPGLSVEVLTKAEYDAIPIKDPNRIYKITDGTPSFSLANISDAGSMAGQNSNAVFITGGTVSGINDITVADGGTGASDALTARANLGLAIGTNVQAFSDNLSALSGLTSAADQLPYFTGAGNAGVTPITSFARTFLDDVNSTIARQTLGLVIGTDVQAFSNNLSALSGLTSAADTLPYFTGSGTASLLPVSAYVQGLLGNTDAATARTTLELGTIATQNANTVNITGGSIAGITDLTIADGGTGASTATAARTNLKAIGSDVTGITGASEISNMVAMNKANFLAIPIPDPGTIYHITDAPTLDLAENTAISTFGATLVDDADAATARATLGLGDSAVLNAGVADGVATLDSGGKIPSGQLPASVDEILEYANLAAFPGTGEASKIYVAQDTNLTYRWSGSAYIEISASLALGTTASTAYQGDLGQIAYSHTSLTTNPHSVTAAQVGLGNVDNTSDADKPISTATQSALNAKQDSSSALVLGTTASTAYRGDFGNTAYTHTSLTTNPHSVTAAQVGLGNVDNTSDADKPISTATQTALNAKQASDAELTALAGLVSAANQLPYFIGSGTAALTALSAFGRTLIDDGDAATARATLGLGDSAVLNAAVANGVATLDGSGKVLTAQLPSYVDDVLEFANLAGFPGTGEVGKIYVAQDTNLTYRWSGSAYVEISASLALGTTSSTAYRGDLGQIAYSHTSLTTNPHSVTAAQVGLGNVNNTSDLAKPISTATQTALNAKQDSSSALALGTTSSTAYRGDFGNTAYTHTSLTTNPHSVTAAQVGLGNVNNTSDLAKPISTATQTALNAKQASDSELSALAGLVSAANRLPYFTGSGTAALTTLSAFGRTLIDDANATTARATLGLSNVNNTSDLAKPISTATQTALNAKQASDAELTALAGLASAANRLPYFTGSGTAALTVLSAFGRTLIDDANATTARATLGLSNVNTTEEGTFTPTLRTLGNAAEPTYSIQDGRYIKIGKKVSIVLYLKASSTMASGSLFLEIRGLPFAVQSGYFGVPVIRQSDLTGIAAGPACGYTSPFTNTSIFIETDGVGNYLDYTKINNGSEFMVNMTYFTT